MFQSSNLVVLKNDGTCSFKDNMIPFMVVLVEVSLQSVFCCQGRKFSIEGLLGTDVHSNALSNGSLVIFRLAPQVQRLISLGKKNPCLQKIYSGILQITFCNLQDYHRFHVPVSGTVEKIVEAPGYLYTVQNTYLDMLYLCVERDVFVLCALQSFHYLCALKDLC